MKLLVVGATGRLGREVVDLALRRGHSVRALARGAGAVDWPEGATAAPCDVLEARAVRAAMDGVDAVIVALSMVRASDSPWARILTPLDLHVRAAQTLVAAATEAGVRRYVTVSAHGVGDSASRAGTLFLALVRSSNIGVAYADLARAEEVVAASDLAWTVVRPTRLTLQPPTGRRRADPNLVTTSWDRIPRGDVAAFLVQAAEEEHPTHQRVSLSSA